MVLHTKEEQSKEQFLSVDVCIKSMQAQGAVFILPWEQVYNIK